MWRPWQSKTPKLSGLSISPCLFSPLRSGLSLPRHKSPGSVQAEKYEEVVVPSQLFSFPGGAGRLSNTFYKNNACTFYFALSCKIKCSWKIQSLGSDLFYLKAKERMGPRVLPGGVAHCNSAVGLLETMAQLNVEISSWRLSQ